MFGVKRPSPMHAHQIVVDHGPDLVVAQQRQRIQLMRRAESIEEMDERDAGLQRRSLCDQRRVMRLLHGAGRKLRETARAHRHNIGMIAEDRQGLRRH